MSLCLSLCVVFVCALALSISFSFSLSLSSFSLVLYPVLFLPITPFSLSLFLFLSFSFSLSLRFFLPLSFSLISISSVYSLFSLWTMCNPLNGSYFPHLFPFVPNPGTLDLPGCVGKGMSAEVVFSFELIYISFFPLFFQIYVFPFLALLCCGLLFK